MKSYTIIEPKTDHELTEYYRIRYEVLRKPWNQPAFATKDDTEDQSFHFLVINENGESIATGRIKFNTEEEAQLRSMAVIDKYQGKGIGSLLVKHIEDYARQRNFKTMILDAREKAIPFYERNGYKITKLSYLLFNEIQHYQMMKYL